MARRQWRGCATVFVVGLSLTALVVLFAPRKFQSDAKLLLKLGRENLSLDPTVASAGQTAAVLRTNESEVTTALQMMQNETVLERVVEVVGAEAILKGQLRTGRSSSGLLKPLKDAVKSMTKWVDPVGENEQAVEALQDDLKIKAEKNSNVVNISYRTKSPELAQRVTQTWVNAYKQEHASMNSITSSLEFFEKQELLLVRKLDEARNRLRNMKSEYGIVTVSGRQATLESQLEWAHHSLIQNRARLAGTKARLATLNTLQGTTQPKVVTSELKSDTNDAASTMRDRLYELEIEQSRLATRYTTKHPRYLQMAQLIGEARRVMSRQQDESGEVTEGINPVYTTLMEDMSLSTGETESLESEVKATLGIINELQRDLRDLNDQEAELAVVERQVEVLEKEYRAHFERREQARLAVELEASEVSNIKVIQPATLREKPVTPNKKICAILGLVGAIGCSLGFGLLRESTHQESETQTEASLTSMPPSPPRDHHQSVGRNSGTSSATKHETLNGMGERRNGFVQEVEVETYVQPVANMDLEALRTQHSIANQ